MPRRSVVLELSNDVELDVFATMLTKLTTLLQALQKNEPSRARVAMTINYLLLGSAAAGAALESDDDTLVENISTGYLRVGKAMSVDNLLSFPANVARPAREMIKIISRGHGHHLTMANDQADVVVLPTAIRGPKSATVRAIGGIEGRIQTLSSRDRLNFILYEGAHDHGVRCYLADEQQDLVRDLWDRRALVTGTITRDATSGRPLSIRQIRTVTALPERDQTNYQRAIGVLKPLIPADLKPEELIRRWRDA